MDRHPPAVMPPIVRDSLRDVIANDAYAATFQSMRHYRQSILQHLDNIDAAYRAFNPQATETTMTANTERDGFQMPLAAIAYPAEHPYPVALRRVAALEAAIARSSIVDVAALPRWTQEWSKPMKQDQQYGPWVLLVDVMRHARPARPADVHLVNASDAQWSAAVMTAQIVYSDSPEALQAIDYLVALRAFAKDSGKPIPAPAVRATEQMGARDE